MPEKPKIESAEYWLFTYKKGPAPATTGLVQAKTERNATLVAAKWCSLESARFIGGSVKPMILANEDILKLPDGPLEEQPLGDAVSGTTA